MNIAILGTINKDLILPFEGPPIQSFGGIFYSISTLSKLGGTDILIKPISYIGEDVHQPLLALLKKDNNVSSNGLIVANQKNHEVILEYLSPEERIEKALFNFPSLEWNQIKKISNADFLLVNFITGWDLTLKSFLKLSKRYFHKMYIDIHFLVMGVDTLGRRIPKCPENIRQWLHGAKFVQMNQREFEIINGSPQNEISFYENNFNQDQILIITLGREGARVIFRKNGMIRNKHFPAFRVNKIKDSTGCGDVFGASFVWKYLKSNDIYKSMEFATKVAAANCLLRGTNEMDNLLSQMEKLKRF